MLIFDIATIFNLNRLNNDWPALNNRTIVCTGKPKTVFEE
jgi:hypothetical protein